MTNTFSAVYQTFITILALSGIIWWTARLLNQLEGDRKQVPDSTTSHLL